MVCGSCGRATKAGARFCGGCGASLAPRCPACGGEIEPDLRFCEACGASLAAPGADAAVARKVVTVVFADLIGSTALHERLDPESVSRIMEGYHAAVRAPIEAHAGTVVQLLGDGVMCAFGVPRVAEDDALRAVRAAVAVQRSFHAFLGEHAELAGRVGLRVAVNTGEVVVSDDYAAGIGDPLNVAARLQQEATDGDVLIGEATERLVAEQVTLARVGSFALKGRAEPVTAWRVVSLERPAGAAATPFVGRDDELRRLAAVYEAALAAPAARLAVLLGSPGLGKSRLLAELARQLEGRASVLTAQCNPAGGATFAPLAEALRAHLGLEAGTADEALRAALDTRVPGDEAERARIAKGIGALLAGKPASPEETFFVVRRLLSALAAERPLVLAIDDVQWAEPLLLDFTEHLVQWGSGIPLLVLVAARPELRDTRSSLTTAGGLVSDVVTLGGLDAGAAMRLAANVVGADTLPAAVAGRVLTSSEGNPLFLRELVRMLVNDGALRRDGGRWTLAVDLAALEMPPTIQALLAARIERLRPEERLVLERAAVIGRQFSRAAVTHLLPREAHADLDARLEALRRSELIEPGAGWLLGEPTLRFHHVLIRDAAYRRVLRGTRADLHARFADWLEARAGGSVEHDETIGWHLEQAHRHLRELGPLDANGLALGERAARHLAAAGRAALARDDLQPAGSLLGRALDCLGDADPARADLALDWCEALLAAGDVGPGARAIAELGRFTAGSERLGAWHTCFGGQLAALADPKALRTSAEAVAAAAEALAAAGDVAGEAKAHAVHADALARLGEIGACEAALDKALAAARRADDRRRANAVLAGAPLAALWGPSPVTRASGRCLDVVRVLRITQGAPAVEAVALRCQAVLETLRGRSQAARRMIASSRRLVEELGITQRLLEVDASAGLIELLEGDAVSAEGWLRRAYEGFRAHGLGVDAARAVALLARALLAQGRAAEAEALSHESEALAGDDFKAAIAWRGVRAEALAGRGEHAAGVELARAAVEIAAATDDLLDHADARSALAVALRAAGRSGEAGAEEARATRLWEQKGATLLAERARRGAASAAPAAGAPDARVERPRAERRRVRGNAASANAARIGAAIAARDAGALADLLCAEMEIVHRPTGAVFDRAGCLESHRGLLGMEGLSFEVEPLATLGDALALSRVGASWGSAPVGDDLEAGAGELSELVLNEVDASGRRRRAEVFAADRLGEAVARLYERYADLLPDGPARARAAATARSLATFFGPIDAGLWATAIAPGAEFVDHRHLGFEPARGAEAFLRVVRSLLEIAGDTANRVDDVLDLRPDALLLPLTNLGTLGTGGAYERRMIQVCLFGADGLVARLEMFDTDRDVEALARFDELTAERPAPAPMRRRVRPNAATANVARVNAAVAARDADALPALLSDGYRVVHHAAGAVLNSQELLAWWRLLFTEDRDFAFREEPLATLGDSLVLCRESWSGTESRGRAFEVGAFERDGFLLGEVDAQARAERAEYFGPDRLGDAIVRLYQRHAELLPDGPECTRASATAHSVAALPLIRQSATTPYGTELASDIEWFDHRSVGIGSLHGREALLRHFRALLELTETWAARVDDILCLRADALLVRWTNSGTQRAGGGAYERHLLQLWAFGADGLVRRWEQFDAEQEAEALARFDELTAEPPPTRPVRRRVRSNAATANAARLNAAIAARDADAILALVSEGFEGVLHPTGLVLDRQETLAWWRLFFADRDAGFRAEPLAVLGDSLALCCQTWAGSASDDAALDVGPYQRDVFALIEADAQARVERLEVFDFDRLASAVARLYERYAELLPDGPERRRAAAIARSVAVWNGDLERYAASLAPSVEVRDHRILGTWSLRGAEEFLRHWSAQLGVGSVDVRDHELLALEPDAFLVRRTWFGADRVGGGAFEMENLALFAFGADGLVTRVELFDTDRDAEALARFDELAEPPAPPPTRRRVRPNAATATVARTNAAVAARDSDALAPWHSDRLEAVLHATGAVLDRQQALDWWSLSFEEDRGGGFRVEPIATLGDSLVLSRNSWIGTASAGPRFDIGAYQMDSFHLVEVDAEARLERVEVFAEDRLGDAVAHLYERYAELLPEGPARARAAAIARSVAAALGPYEIGRYAEGFAPDIRYEDRRTLGLGSARGAEAVLRVLGTMLEVADGVANRIDDVLGLRAGALLSRWTNFGTGRVGGGAYERQFLWLGVFGADGLLTRIELFDADRDAEALARFDELTAEPPETPFANAAWRAVEESDRAIERRDWDALVARHAPGAVFDDRRPLVRTRVEGEAYLAHLRFLFDARREISRRLLATRGERLELDRQLTTSAASHGGLAEFEMLCLNEVDATGRRVAVVAFDLDDLDAAYAELDTRYAAGEGAPRARSLASIQRFETALAARDWADLTRRIAPDFAWRDHRPLGLHEEGSRDEYLASLRAWLELAPDARARIDHVLAQDDRHGLAVVRWVGSREGGSFEIQFVVVTLLDPAGRIRHFDTYDLEQLDAARARFAALAAVPRKPWIENAATRSFDELQAAWESRDWERFAATMAPEFRRIDRRSMMRLDLDREEHLALARPLFEMESSQLQVEVLATRGDRLALARTRFEGADRDVGPSVIEWVDVYEVDARGKLVAFVLFDRDDLGAAYAELDERYGPTGIHTLLLPRLNAQDWDGVAALLAPDFVIEDHRLLGWGTVHGPAAYIASCQALVDLAPDTRLRLDHLEASDRGALGITMLSGTREGGVFEDSRVVVVELDAQGRLCRLDWYDLDELDEARVRFDAIASAPRDPLAALVPPNAASAALDRLVAAFEARDWAAVRALAGEGARFEDRRRQLRDSGDVDWLVANLELEVDGSGLGHFQRSLVATAGDRICLERSLWSGGPAAGRVEIEYLWLAEVDESGRLVAGAMFGADDRRAAIRDASSRWLARDAAAAAVGGPMLVAMQAWNDRDRARMRSVLADDFVNHDHRLTGEGRVDGVDANLDNMVAMWGLAPDARIELRSVLALERHGVVAVTWYSGTLPEGGAWESYIVNVATVDRGRVTRLELFEIEQLDAALARLAELRPDPLRIPPNAATRASDRFWEASEREEWEALRAACAPHIVTADRRRQVLIEGDIEMLIASHAHMFSRGRTRVARTVLATAGDRLVLERILWSGAGDAPPFQVETLVACEVDVEGRIVAAMAFDPDDRRAASAELFERYARSDAGRWLPPHAIEFRRALFDRDLERIRAALPDDFVFDDHRRTGLGRLEGADRYVAGLAAQYELAPDTIFEPLYYVAAEAHGHLAVFRMFGSLAEGGAFEGVFVRLELHQGDRIVAAEAFEPEDLDRARARFEELRPDPTRIPPNAASRARDRSVEAWRARDWEALRALASPDFTFEDRSKRILVKGDVETWIEDNRFMPPGSGERQLIGTAGERVALERNLWIGEPDGGPVELEKLRLTEVGADGRIRAVIWFDPDDRAAAFAEAQARFAAGEAGAVRGQEPIAAFGLACTRRDWPSARECLADDFLLRDHRSLVLGALGRDPWIESLRAMADLSSGWGWEPLRILAWNRHGRVEVSRIFGTTLHDGGPFENVCVRALVTDGDRIRSNDSFDAAAADRALARFEELCAGLP
jgi:class 3 adenylate cyclase